MNATIHDLDGDEAGDVDLPTAFAAHPRPDLVKRAVRAAQANAKQDYGSDEYAGMRTPAESFGSGRGMAHVPREGGQARRVPQTVGGRRAHPPKAEKDRSESINDKERKAAIESAIAATAEAELVRERGHQFDDDVELPIVLADAFEDLQKTQAVVDVIEGLGIAADVERAEDATVKAGQGSTRGRKYRRPSSILFVTSDEPSKAARNLAGADVTTGREVNAEDLAPGGIPGRLTVWTESALAEVSER
jgi:large subunit ribosomal protein L4e